MVPDGARPWRRGRSGDCELEIGESPAKIGESSAEISLGDKRAVP